MFGTTDPLKKLEFSSREECIISYLGTVDQQQSVEHLCSVFGPAAFGRRVAVNERASLFIPRSGLSLAKQTQISLHLSAAALL